MQQEKNQRIAIIGLPGSSKSTFAAKLRKKYPQTCFRIFHNQKDANKFIEEIKEINNYVI